MTAAVDTLRRAATLMRTRAEAATAGPWEVVQDQHRDFIVPEVSVWSDAAMSYVTEDVVTHPGSPFLANAEHIASWHPAVAVAVAAWLDAEIWTWRYGTPTPSSNHALTVARAYLEEDQ